MIDVIYEELTKEFPELSQHIPEDTLKSSISAYISDYQEKRVLPNLKKRSPYMSRLKALVKEKVKLPRKAYVRNRERPKYVAPKEKKCTKCKNKLFIEMFTVQPNGRHKSACKACVYQLYYRPSSIKRLRRFGKKPKAEMIMTDEEKREKQRIWKRNYRKRPEVRIANNLRNRIRTLLKKRNSRYQGKNELIECTKEEFLQHLESQFKPGMTWENYGEWHVDHVQPLCSFDLTDEEQLKKASHYTNLRPLWSYENAEKSKEDIKKKLVTDAE